MCLARLLSSSVFAFVALALSASPHAVAEELPKLDVTQSCRAASDQNKATFEACMADEERARARLARDWGQSASADRTNCTQLSSMRGFQSYVELLTCLEMAADAKKLPKDITRQ